ncbi:hypothetical protein RRF57_010850 [Xylaria bambusicola]|uniref:Glycosyl hydrolase family 92 domain-containing protein n=1 Tax=Xylaria bambusicola TaxID=326684 RepID=A0AAN7ZDH3_9PEZI
MKTTLADLSVNRSKADESRLGYYKSSLFNGITVEMGATGRAGMYKYEFPEDSGSSNVVVDVSHVLSSYRGQGLGQTYLGGNITITPTDEGIRYEGSGSYDNVFADDETNDSGYGWNRAPEWTVYFCGYFDQPATFKTFLGKSATGTTLDQYGNSTSQESKSRLGAVFTFDSISVTSRVGVSFISSEQACRGVQSEIPAGTKLDTLEKGAKDAWSDGFRSHTPLLQILQPTAYEELIRSVIDVWRFEGFMPDARSSFFNGATQGGSNADNVLADAYVKGVRGAINWEEGFVAMLTDAEIVPPNNNDPRDTSSSTKEGRGALPDWIEHGYITTKYRRSLKTPYSALNDFALYQVAKGLNNETAAEKYLKRSRNWRNQWNPDLEALNFTGFLGPRDSSGNWVSQDPLSCGGCYWGDDYYQGLPMEYSFNAHHDVATLIEYSGGKDAFVARLEAMFTPGLSSGNSQFGHTLFNPGNEPSFATPYLFNFAGRQDLSVKYSRAVARSYYAPTESGLPGNSDAGAMESWVLWNMIGLYPLTGQTTFLIASPWFADLTIDLGSDKKLIITAENVAQESYYVQSLSVNGKSWDKAWILWDDVFANGGTMDFVLGPEPVDWATGDLPPSPASEE